jgi:putative hydrolase of the HAD superfamily
MTVEFVGLDGDDTLWRNEEYFLGTLAAFRSLIGPYVNGDVDIDERLEVTGSPVLRVRREGLHAVADRDGHRRHQRPGHRRRGAGPVDLGKGMLQQPVELIEGVAETVPILAERYKLIVVTKGDLWNQEQKLARSGLADLMYGVEIVAEKDLATYRRILHRYEIDPATFVMVGNSVRSDILPVLEAGGRAVHIPHELTWALEFAEHDGSVPTLASIKELPEWLEVHG